MWNFLRPLLSLFPSLTFTTYRSNCFEITFFCASWPFLWILPYFSCSNVTPVEVVRSETLFVCEFKRGVDATGDAWIMVQYVGKYRVLAVRRDMSCVRPVENDCCNVPHLFEHEACGRGRVRILNPSSLFVWTRCGDTTLFHNKIPKKKRWFSLVPPQF